MSLLSNYKYIPLCCCQRTIHMQEHLAELLWPSANPPSSCLVVHGPDQAHQLPLLIQRSRHLLFSSPPPPVSRQGFLDVRLGHQVSIVHIIEWNLCTFRRKSLPNLITISSISARGNEWSSRTDNCNVPVPWNYTFKCLCSEIHSMPAMYGFYPQSEKKKFWVTHHVFLMTPWALFSHGEPSAHQESSDSCHFSTCFSVISSALWCRISQQL